MIPGFLDFDELRHGGSLYLITDDVASPATFLLHRAIHASLKKASGNRCVIVSSEDISYWKAIAIRSGVNLDDCQRSGTLNFVDCFDALSLPSKPFVLSQNEHDLSLSLLFRRIEECLAAHTTGTPFIVIDDVASLEWTGLSPTEVSRFVRALVSLARRFDATIIARQHVLGSPTPNLATRILLELCAVHVEVLPLATGRSGAVTGEIAIHRGHAAGRDQELKVVPRSRAVQYKLSDHSALFFQRGTGAGIL
ncbi:hypothetical protein SISNIDRAFT_486060 [Sistotremastrum niveocremeum HHB9708]|uniref:KaiC-like domain-containing protein n=1 Tax=Sistotremastrum niveocremeum HHB9708 TaxID=1314777 RepID=A0A164UDE3_9AGAM|nr:hypothetical protein SISNIDRAFT_486060 [Sistotremastrum niveocremeum HHB9708]